VRRPEDLLGFPRNDKLGLKRQAYHFLVKQISDFRRIVFGVKSRRCFGDGWNVYKIWIANYRLLRPQYGASDVPWLLRFDKSEDKKCRTAFSADNEFSVPIVEGRIAVSSSMA
jgi:hypothetical protein